MFIIVCLNIYETNLIIIDGWVDGLMDGLVLLL